MLILLVSISLHYGARYPKIPLANAFLAHDVHSTPSNIISMVITQIDMNVENIPDGYSPRMLIEVHLLFLARYGSALQVL